MVQSKCGSTKDLNLYRIETGRVSKTSRIREPCYETSWHIFPRGTEKRRDNAIYLICIFTICLSRQSILIFGGARRPGRTPPAACGFPTRSWQIQSYPLANHQLKPLRTSTSRLDHSESPKTVTFYNEIKTLRLTFSTRSKSQSRMST